MNFLAMELDAISEGSTSYWTGGTDKGREGQWFWISSLKAMGDFIFYSGQPNHGLVSNCLALYSGFDYKGDDYICSRTIYPICQMYI